MNTLCISLIEKKPHRDGSTIDFLKNFEVFLVRNEARTILLQDIIQQNETPILVQIQNNQLTTLLDATGVSPYEMWYFDDTFQFTGKAYSLHQGNGTFHIQTQAKWILFLHLSSNEFADLKQFKCTELDISNKYAVIKKSFPHGYGVFPYLIINQEKSPCFSQIPIHINPIKQNLPGQSIAIESYIMADEDLLTNKLIEEVKVVYKKLCEAKNKILKMALVLDAKKAYYFNGENEVSFSESIPSGGVLLDMNGRQIADNSKHYLL